MSEARDPRVDPRPGDVVRLRDGTVATVASVRVHVFAEQWDDTWNMDEFRDEAKDAEIVKVSE